MLSVVWARGFVGGVTVETEDQKPSASLRDNSEAISGITLTPRGEEVYGQLKEDIAGFLSSDTGPTVLVAAVGVVVAFLSYRHGVNAKRRELDAKNRELQIAERKLAMSEVARPRSMPNILLWWEPTYIGTPATCRFRIQIANCDDRPIALSGIRYSWTGSEGSWGGVIRRTVGGRKSAPFQIHLDPTQQCEIVFDAENLLNYPPSTGFRWHLDMSRKILSTRITVVLTTGESYGVPAPEDFMRAMVDGCGSRLVRAVAWLKL